MSPSTIRSAPTAGQALPYNRISANTPHAGIPGWAVCIWAIGVLVLSVRATGGWLGIQNLRDRAVPASRELDVLLKRLKSKLGVSAPVRLYVSAMVRVPTVFGCLRPYVLLPVTLLTGLSELQIEAILAHELAHIRRHDYFVNVLQTAVETVLFYHPAVWWVGGQMRLERELCCDDLAVAVCGNAFQYANALVEMEMIRDRNPEPAVAATGGDLLARIRRLLGPPQRAPRSLGTIAAGTLMLSIAAAMAMVSLYASPQEKTASPRAEFEVASIKANKSFTALMRFQPMPGGRLVAENVPLRYLIMTAYDIAASQISGGPGFGEEADRYNIEAKAPEGADSRQLKHEMLQTLLETRFRLKYHWVTEQRRVYELTVEKGGPKLKQSAEGSCIRIEDAALGPLAKPGDPVICGFRGIGYDGLNRTLEMMGVTITELNRVFATIGARNVIDRTGLSGTFDISLRWTSCPALGLAGPADPDMPAAAAECDGGPSLLTAVKEQLGLKLAAAKGPVPVLIIDNLEKPSEN